MHTPPFFRNEYTPSTGKILIKEGNIGLVSSEFEAIRENKPKYINNPLISYLNINSVRHRIFDLTEIILELSLDYLFLRETKIDQSFPTAEIYIKRYELRARRDTDKHGGGLIELVKNGFTLKGLINMRLNKVKVFVQSLPWQTGNGYP